MQKNRKDVSKTYIGGSVGKSTSIIYPDFDCVVFLNNKYPPLKAMVQEFEMLLRERIKEFEIVENTLKTTHLTVKLLFTNGVEMDLLPATNFSAENPESQRFQVMTKIRDDPKHHSWYSSSLAQTQIKFIREQSGATHQLIRLAKYWFKLCTLDKEIYGGSSIIEILCVDVAFDLDPNPRSPMNHSFSMLPAFRLFLEKISRMNSLKLGFCREANTWVRVAPHEFRSARFRDCFSDAIVQRPNFIVEPSNPYNDLAENIPPPSFERLSEFSTEMLMRLNDLESPVTNNMKTVSGIGSQAILNVNYGNFFKPFIMSLREHYPSSAIPTNISIDYYYQNYAHENASERKPEFFTQNKLAKIVYKTVMNNLLFLIRGKAMRKAYAPNGLCFTDGIADVSSRDDVRAAVNLFVQANFGLVINVTSANADHVHHHVTLTIPYRLVKESRVYAVRFSMTWSNYVENNSSQSTCWPF